MAKLHIKLQNYLNKTTKYLNGKSVERRKINICIEKLDKYIRKIKNSCLQITTLRFLGICLKSNPDICINQRFQMIEIKKFAEAHDLIKPYLAKRTKANVFSTSIYSESKHSKSKFSRDSGSSAPLMRDTSTKEGIDKVVSSMVNQLDKTEAWFCSVNRVNNLL